MAAELLAGMSCRQAADSVPGVQAMLSESSVCDRAGCSNDELAFILVPLLVPGSNPCAGGVPLPEGLELQLGLQPQLTGMSMYASWADFVG